MSRLSKKEIKAALDKLKEPQQAHQSANESQYTSKPLEAKKPNKNRIRKQGI
jgi:hypothetical protein